MILLVVLFVVLAAGSIGIGVAAHRRHASLAGGPSAWGAAAVARFGPVGGPVAVVVVGWIVTLVFGLAFGFLAKALEASVDKPVFDWVIPRVHAGAFTTLNNKLTLIGDTATVELVTLFAIVVLAAAFGRRAWWLPTSGLVLFFFSERYLQNFLADVVDRGHPPTTLGTFPSGGVCRILAVYGAVLAFVIVLQPTLRRSWRAGLWTGLMTTAVIEAYTRIYLSKHWFTDAVFALPVGTLMLLTNIAAVTAATIAIGRDPVTHTPVPDGTKPVARSGR